MTTKLRCVQSKQSRPGFSSRLILLLCRNNHFTVTKLRVYLCLLCNSFPARYNVRTNQKLWHSSFILIPPTPPCIIFNHMAPSRKGKTSGVSSSSFFDLQAEIAKHEADFAKNKASGQTTLVGGVKRPDKVRNTVYSTSFII